MKTNKFFFTFSLIVSFFLVTGFYFSKKQSHDVKIVATKMNVFYAGVDNLVDVYCPGIKNENLAITFRGNGKIVANSGGGYVVNANAPGVVAVIVSEKNGDKINFLDSMQFRVKRIPDPVISIGGVKGEGELTSDQVNEIGGIVATLENFDFDCSFNVISFTMSLPQNGKWLDISGVGPNLNPLMKQTFKYQPVGTRIYFHEITVQGSDGILRKVPGVMIKVK